MANPDEAAADRLRRLIDAYTVSQAIAVMAALGIADVLADGPRSADAIAEAVGAHPRALARLLRALAAVGVVAHEGGDAFALTPMGQRLRADHPASLRPAAVHAGQPAMWAAWGHLLHSVRTGDPAFPMVHGIGVWDYRARHPEAGRAFADAMAAGAREVAAAIVRAYDFSAARSVVDVGGGDGVLLAEILAAHPSVRGVLVEQAAVVERARAVLAAASVAERCTLVAGDFLEAVPAGGDVYVLKGVLHDWGDADALRILGNGRAAMTPGSRLLVIEQVLADDLVEPFACFMDLHMLVVHGGGERSRDEFERLLRAAGFALRRLVPTGSALQVIEAAPIEKRTTGTTAEWQTRSWPDAHK